MNLLSRQNHVRIQLCFPWKSDQDLLHCCGNRAQFQILLNHLLTYKPQVYLFSRIRGSVSIRVRYCIKLNFE